MMLKKSELQAYIRTRKEGYPDDESRLRGLIAANIVRIIEQIEDAHLRRQDARTEVESLSADADFAKYQLSLEENWKEFGYLFALDDCSGEFKKTVKAPLFEISDSALRHLDELEATLNTAFVQLREIRRTLREAL